MINRNNYEEYFLLLADKELSPVEEAAVMQFAAKHPDLQEELDILLSCRLDAEPMPFFPKEKLLRPTLWNVENPKAIQTQMLLLLDGELPAAEQQQLQAQITASTALQAEWKSLQQVKLAAETIAHPNKETLHHHDRKVRPLLWMRWAAAAAVVTGLGWLLWTQEEQKIAPSNTTLAVVPAQKAITQPAEAIQSTHLQTTATENDTQPTETLATNTIIPKEVATSTQLPRAQRESIKKMVPAESTDNLNSATYIRLTPIEPDPVLATLNSTDVQLTLAGGSENNTTQIAHLTAKPIAVSMLAASQKQDVFAGKKDAVAVEEPEYVSVGGARINKQKMRGLFRNVTRSVARSFSKSKLEPDVYATR